ncbi:MAG: (E)-4-hydroxy-3-methylbut-2-enyl-diphosphate synthase [Prevotellaceae bacterium]|jgi:(E)-4-hydroxy-3-methylbut-2-enyl-diphosphate synthase|nr:(E)-4-hydroxy-3-methylbut-2-enyl-diphosphate synthase [Prevotellaceae bacterium]
MLQFSSSEVYVGRLPLGGPHPVRLQSMTTTGTLHVQDTVAQCIALARAGADYVRITAQGVREAEALQQIKAALRQQGCDIPLIADIHFNPAASEVAAQHVEKVRINPGNFVDRANVAEDAAALREKLIRLLDICRAHGAALRIGVNHGSLSARMMARYGDTPLGMVESAMEFLHICRDENFSAVVVSMKSSNTRVMVYATRLLAQRMAAEGLRYPLHLGVTEAGEGEDGRLKSAVGIGAVLADGLGDTIRVSLTEDPCHEIPVARKLAGYLAGVGKGYPADGEAAAHDFFSYSKRQTTSASLAPVGGDKPVAVVADLSSAGLITQEDVARLGFTFDGQAWQGGDATPDALYVGTAVTGNFPLAGLPLFGEDSERLLRCTPDFLTDAHIAFLKSNPQTLLLLALEEGAKKLSEQRRFFLALQQHGLTNPVLLHRSYSAPDDYEALQLQAAVDFGALLIDGFGDGVMLSAQQPLQAKGATADLARTAFGILQAARVRFSKAEYIACPGCGRTLFDLQKTLQDVKKHTERFRGMKLAVMGCMVNGPGEMADADYGYVGAGAGRVSLYKGRECVKKNIEQEHAVSELIALIAQDEKR